MKTPKPSAIIVVLTLLLLPTIYIAIQLYNGTQEETTKNFVCAKTTGECFSPGLAQTLILTMEFTKDQTFKRERAWCTLTKTCGYGVGARCFAHKELCDVERASTPCDKNPSPCFKTTQEELP